MDILWNGIAFVMYAILFMALVAVLVVVVAFALELAKTFFGKRETGKKTGGDRHE